MPRCSVRSSDARLPRTVARAMTPRSVAVEPSSQALKNLEKEKPTKGFLHKFVKLVQFFPRILRELISESKKQRGG